MLKKYILLGIGIALALSLTACGGQASAGDNDADTGYVEEGMMDMGETNEVSSIDAYGVIESTKETTISVDFNARVDKIYVKQGERIKEGDQLVDFDISALENDIASKKMDITEAQFELNKQDTSVAQASIELQNAKESLATKDREYKQKQSLHEAGAVSDDALTQAKEAYEEQKRSVDKMTLDLSNAKSTLNGNTQSNLNKLTRLQDELRRLEEKYSKANFVNGNQIVSTIKNGVVSSVGATEGAYVDRDVKVLKLVDLDSRIVKVDIAEEFIGKIFEGQTAIVTSQAVPDKEYHGKVVRIWGTSVEKNGETIIPIEIALDDIDDKLLLNFNVDVKIELGEDQSSEN